MTAKNSRRWFIFTSASAVACLSGCSDGAAASAGTAGGSSGGDVGSCTGVPTAEQTEGPAYSPTDQDRSDVREGLGGAALEVTFIVYDTDCGLIEGAELEIWTANDDGEYSDLTTFDTVGESWLRGLQTTGSDGSGTFTTNVPPPYEPRTSHLHLKVRASGFDELTTQLYFPQEVIDTLFSGEITPNSADDHYAAELEMDLVEEASGYSTVVAIVLG